MESRDVLLGLYEVIEKEKFPASMVIAACYKVAAAMNPYYPLNQSPYLEAYEFFFRSYIRGYNFYDDKYGKNEYCFINDKKEKIEINKIFGLLHYIGLE